MEKIDVIILSYANSPQLRKVTEDGIKSLLDSEDPQKIYFNILVIESCPSAQPFDFNQTTTYFPKSKFGFHKNFNFGIKKSNNPYVCLANNDLIYSKGWATAILKGMREEPESWSASPLCPTHHPAKGIGIQPNSGLYHGYKVRWEVAGWCLFFDRRMLNKTGLLDEKFTFWYADNDYANTLKKYKINHVLVTNSIVEHLESKTLRSKDPETQHIMTVAERYYFEYKWGERSWISYMNYKRKKLFGLRV